MVKIGRATKSIPRSTCTYVVVRGNMDKSGDHRRWYDSLVIMSFVAECTGGTLRTGVHSAILTVPDTHDDPATVNSRVVDYVDIQKADCDDDIPKVVNALVHRLGDVGMGKDAVGKGLVDSHLDRMYMRYDSWRDE